MGLSSRLKVAKLHLITDVRAEQGDFRDFVVEALQGGVDVLQVRDSAASQEEFLEAVAMAQSVALQLNATVAVGQRLDLADRFQADVAHVGAAGESVDEARSRLPEHSLVGQSVHDSERLSASSADYLFVGPVFGGSLDGVTFPGLRLVREAARRHPLPAHDATPWFAVGGITRENLGQVIEAGALRVAVSSAINQAADPRAAASELKQQLLDAWNANPDMKDFALKSFGGGQGLKFITQP